MKQKKQTEKKLSLKKLQMVRIGNPKVIKGGDRNGASPTKLDYNDYTGTIETSRKD